MGLERDAGCHTPPLLRNEWGQRSRTLLRPGRRVKLRLALVFPVTAHPPAATPPVREAAEPGPWPWSVWRMTPRTPAGADPCHSLFRETLAEAPP